LRAAFDRPPWCKFQSLSGSGARNRLNLVRATSRLSETPARTFAHSVGELFGGSEAALVRSRYSRMQSTRKRWVAANVSAHGIRKCTCTTNFGSAPLSAKLWLPSLASLIARRLGCEWQRDGIGGRKERWGLPQNPSHLGYIIEFSKQGRAALEKDVRLSDKTRTCVGTEQYLIGAYAAALNEGTGRRAQPCAPP
jgi:hypothetical protein